MGISTFGSFTQARLGIYASQAGMSVTGNNISNINTVGYTRQKLQQTSFYAGGADRYYSKYDLRIGNGVLATGVSQMRDPYLDIRYRSEMASVGAMDAKLAGLEQVQAVLDEVGDGTDDFGILSTHLSDLLSKLHQLSDQTGLAEYDIQVRTSAETLAKQFNSYASQLEEVRQNSLKAFKQDVESVNKILDNIRALNVSIRKAEIHGDNALELRDERNLLIDELSAYVKIDVKYTEEDIGGGVKVEKLSISLADANPHDYPENTDCTTLIDGIYGRNFTLPDQIKNADGDMVDNTDLMMGLTALTDVKGRPLYTVTKTGVDSISSTTPLTGSSVTDPDTGITTITTYEKVGTDYVDNPLYDPDDPTSLPYLDADNNPADETNAQQLILYTETIYTKSPSTEVELLDNDLYGSLQSQREFLTESGEFTSAETLANVDPDAAGKRGIQFYQKALDLLANQFAKTFNEANQGYLRNEKGEYINADGDPITDADGKILTVTMDLTDAQKEVLANNGKFEGAVLFSNRGDNDDPTNITAANISISKGWASGPRVVNSFVAIQTENGPVVASTDNSNINHMIVKMSEKMNYDPGTITDAASDSMFKGDFNEMWVNIGTLLGNDIRSTGTILDTYYAASVELDTSRSSVSSVDLNDEAANLMQYSQSYNAACRLMTTLDSMLDKLINGTGVLT